MSKVVESKGMSLTSRRWKLDVKGIVNDYNFKLSHVHGDTGKCDFCGNPLVYVAVIDGENLRDKSIKTYGIGLDCLQLVLGTEWAYYLQVDREIKRLKKIAAAKSRAKKYAVEYKDIIEWLTGFHPEYVKKNLFYRDMIAILTEGKKVFSKNMEKVLRSRMGKIRMSVAEYDEKLKHHKEVVIPRIAKLLDLVKEVDNINENTFDIPKYSAFNFVYSVMSSAIERNTLTPGQKDGLNKVYVRYTKMKKERGAMSTKKEVDMSGIPY